MSTKVPDHITICPEKISSVELDWEVLREIRLDVDSYPRTPKAVVIGDYRKGTAGTGSVRFMDVSSVPPVVLGSFDFADRAWKDKVTELSGLPASGKITIEMHMKTDDVNPVRAKAVELVVT